jgi:putative endonuclease
LEMDVPLPPVARSFANAQDDAARYVMKTYYVYIMTNCSRTLYTSVTNNLERRVYEHKHKLVPGFTSKYNIKKLVYYEEGNDVNAAIAR